MDTLCHWYTEKAQHVEEDIVIPDPGSSRNRVSFVVRDLWICVLLLTGYSSVASHVVKFAIWHYHSGRNRRIPVISIVLRFFSFFFVNTSFGAAVLQYREFKQQLVFRVLPRISPSCTARISSAVTSSQISKYNVSWILFCRYANSFFVFTFYLPVRSMSSLWNKCSVGGHVILYRWLAYRITDDSTQFRCFCDSSAAWYQ